MSTEYRLTVTADYLGVVLNNVFHYTSSSNIKTQADNLLQAFRDDILPLMTAFQHVSVDYGSLYAIDVNTQTDYATLALDETGERGSSTTPLPAFVTAAFTLYTTQSTIRHGFKRISGINRDDVESGGPTATLLGLLEDFAVAQNNILSNGGFNFAPIVARYDNSEPPVMTAFTNVTDCAFRRLSTQNTRKT